MTRVYLKLHLEEGFRCQTILTFFHLNISLAARANVMCLLGSSLVIALFNRNKGHIKALFNLFFGDTMYGVRGKS
jgi:hypothetical protein